MTKCVMHVWRMNPLRQKLIQEMVLRGFSPRTQDSYLSQIQHLALHYKLSPDKLSDQQIKDYLLHLADVRQLSPSSRNQAVNAMRFFFSRVLNRSLDGIPALVPRVKSRSVVPRFTAPRRWNGSFWMDAQTPCSGPFS